MKNKYIIFLSILFMLNFGTAKAGIPVLDSSSVYQTLSINLNLVKQVDVSISEWKALQATMKVIGDIKEGLKELAEWKAEVDEYITLFQMGLDLINESIEVSKAILIDIEHLKRLINQPVELARQAQDLSKRAIEFVAQSDDYYLQYQETLAEANSLMSSGDSTILQQAEGLHNKALELNSISQNYLSQARSLSNQADMLLYEAEGLLIDIENYNRDVIYDMERACLLQVKGIQYKAELQRKFCKNPTPGVVINVETYCDDEYAQKQDEASGVATVCNNKADAIWDKIYGEEE